MLSLVAAARDPEWSVTLGGIATPHICHSRTQPLWKKIQNTLNRNMQEQPQNRPTVVCFNSRKLNEYYNADPFCVFGRCGGFSFRVIPLMLFVILPHTSNHTFWSTQLFQLHRHNLKHLYLDLNDTLQTSHRWTNGCQPSETTAYDDQWTSNASQKHQSWWFSKNIASLTTVKPIKNKKIPRKTMKTKQKPWKPWKTYKEL